MVGAAAATEWRAPARLLRGAGAPAPVARVFCLFFLGPRPGPEPPLSFLPVVPENTLPRCTRVAVVSRITGLFMPWK